MIDRKKLLADLQSLLRKEIEPDLRKRSDLPEIAAALKAEFDKAKKAKRTAMNYTDWRADTITQIGVAWVLSCVFIRFMEDNRLIDPPKLSGQSSVISGQSEKTDNRKLTTDNSRLQRARDEYDLHIQSNPEHSFRQYILSVIDDLAKLPGGKEVFGKNNIIHQHRDWLSNDAAKLLYNFWQKIEPTTGDLVHNFTDDTDEGQPFDTRFLGDLYQDLSEAARKKYALLQTPDFVEAFILDRTLEPALDEFGLEPHAKAQSRKEDSETDLSAFAPSREAYFKMIDPACGSGHFLLGAFDRILDRWQRKEPGTKVDVLVERTLASIHGVDVNPFAVAIARFRLLLAAFRACNVTRLDQPIDFHINVACGDSLYHGKQTQGTLTGIETEESHYFQVENVDELKRILREGVYHAVVANPPYITPKDKAANVAYRDLYESCHRQYSLSVPFMERIFRLAVRGGITQRREDAKEGGQASGFTGQITSNSFMKREFGKKLIESYLAKTDLTHVIDTSGAYIPGHGTPTVILFGRNQTPVVKVIRTVMGIRGEPSTPDDASKGRVWTSIVNLVDEAGSASDFISVANTERGRFATHPWAIGGGGAAELKEELDQRAKVKLSKLSESIGFVCITKADEFFQQPAIALMRKRLEPRFIRTFGLGEEIRDWSVIDGDSVIFPYTSDVATIPLLCIPNIARECWAYKHELGNRKVFGGLSYFESGKHWYEYGQIPIERFKIDRSIPFAFVATHNHFVLDRGGKVFKQSAPVIKLPAEATEDDHLGLLGLLNSSTACFWMKQVFHDKGSTVDSAGARQATVAFENFREFTGTGLQKCPIPKTRPHERARHLDSLAQHLHTISPDAVLSQRRKDAKKESSSHELCDFAPLRETLSTEQTTTTETLGQMVRQQEDLDWECYRLYGLLKDDLTYPCDKSQCIQLGERAFEIIMARKLAAGELQTTWFERHGSSLITELPEDWPDDYKALVNRRIEVIESNRIRTSR